MSQGLLEKSSSVGNILFNTKTIIFLGTPHRGLNHSSVITLSDWILRAVRFLPTPPYQKQLAAESETLYELSRAFSKVLKQTPINIISCYETIPSFKLPMLLNNGIVRHPPF